MRILGWLALVICLILLVTPTGSQHSGGGSFDCGSVLSPRTFNNGNKVCPKQINDRVTGALVVGAGGVAFLYGASRKKKRHQDE